MKRRDYSKPLKGQRESRVQSKDPSGRESRLDARALIAIFGSFQLKKPKALA